MLTPFDERGLAFEVLAEEPRVVALPAGHPLARQSELRVADLDTAFRTTPAPTLWLGPSERELPAIADLAQLLRLVEFGRLAALLPRSVATRQLRPRVTYRAVADAPPAAIAAAWATSTPSPAVAAFVRATREAATTLGGRDGAVR